MSRHLSNNTNCFNVLTTTNINVASDRSEILAWLSPLDPRERHGNIQTTRVDNVGDWFLRTCELRSWYGDSGEGAPDRAVLFCCGDLGVGKTFISSRVIDKLCDQARRRNTAVVCFYLDAAAREEQSPTSIIGSLLKQLVTGLDKIPGEILNAFQDQKMAIGGRAPQFAQIANLFQTITTSQRTIICIDALNECSSRNRLKLLGSLRDILQKSPGTRLFLTARPHIRSEIEKWLGGAMAVVTITTQNCDIINFLYTKLDEDPTPEAMDSTLKADIVDIFDKTVPKVMRAISLKIDEVLGETTISGRRRRLNAMAEGNSEPYSPNTTGLGLTKNTPPSDGNLPSSPEQCSQYSNLYSYHSSNTSYSHLRTIPSSNIDPRLTQSDYPSEHPHRIPSTSTQLDVSSGQLAGATSNPTLSTHQNGTPAQMAGNATHQISIHACHDPGCPQYPAGQGQQAARSPQGQELYPNSNTGGLAPLPPRRPGYVADHSDPRLYTCDICRVQFGRKTDLKRHKDTTRMHYSPSGPACTEPGCKFTGRFMRVDNFRIHYRKTHTKTDEEADAFIAEWRAQGGRARSLRKEGTRVAIRRCESIVS